MFETGLYSVETFVDCSISSTYITVESLMEISVISTATKLRFIERVSVIFNMTSFMTTNLLNIKAVLNHC